MKNKSNRRNEIIIDLTSLLDVIFLVLMVVLCKTQLMQQDIETKDVEASAREAEAEVLIDEANAKQELYSDQIDTQDNLNEYVWAISVYSSYVSDKITERHIRVVSEDKDIKTFDLIGTKDTNAKVFEEFKEYLEENIKEKKDTPVILSLNENDEKILYRDEKKIREIFDEIKEKYSNVYEK